MRRLFVLIVIILIIFVISLINIITSLPGSFNNFIDWIILGIHILVIGHLTKLLYPSYSIMLKRATVVLTLFSFYMALGTGILHYQGEGGYRSDLLQSNVGNEIKYYIDLHNGLKLPVNVDFTFLYGERGMEKTSVTSTKKEGTKDKRVINLTFKITETEAALPTEAVIIYRIFGFIPMVNVMELVLPKNVNSERNKVESTIMLKEPRFAVGLVKQGPVPLSDWVDQQKRLNGTHAYLNSLIIDRTLFTNADVRLYDWKTHEIHFTEAFISKNGIAKKANEKSNEPIANINGGSELFKAKPSDLFLVIVDGRRIYCGNFPEPAWSSRASINPVMLDCNNNGVRICNYSGLEENERLINDQRIYKVFQEEKKLKD